MRQFIFTFIFYTVAANLNFIVYFLGGVKYFLLRRLDVLVHSFSVYFVLQLEVCWYILNY